MDMVQTEEAPQRIETPASSFVSKFKDMHLWNEVGWPILSLLVALRPLHHWVIGKVAKIEQGQKVLEVGSGYPLYSIYADKVGPNGLFTTVDINQNIQKRSRKIGYLIDKFFKHEQQEADLTHVVADANALPFPDNTFDIVIASNFTGGDDYIKEVFRVLNPGGRIIVSWTEALSIPFMAKKCSILCSELGFESIVTKPGAPAHFILGFIWNWYVMATKPETANSTFSASSQPMPE